MRSAEEMSTFLKVGVCSTIGIKKIILQNVQNGSFKRNEHRSENSIFACLLKEFCDYDKRSNASLVAKVLKNHPKSYKFPLVTNQPCSHI